MKNIGVVLIFAALISATGCKKWLDVSPKTQIRERILFENEQGFKDAITGVYIYMGNGSLYGQNLTMGFLDAMGQRYNTSSTAHIFYRAGRYEYSDASIKNYISAIWSNMYTAVGNLNNILVQVDGMQSKFTSNNFNFVKGEALALRALIHY